MRRRGTIVLALSWGVLVRRRMKQWRLSTLSVPLLSLSDLCSRQGRARRRVSDAGRSEKKGAARNRSSRVRHYSHRLPVAGCIDNSSYAAEFSPSRHSTGIAKKKKFGEIAGNQEIQFHLPATGRWAPCLVASNLFRAATLQHGEGQPHDDVAMLFRRRSTGNNGTCTLRLSTPLSFVSSGGAPIAAASGLEADAAGEGGGCVLIWGRAFWLPYRRRYLYALFCQLSPKCRNGEWSIMPEPAGAGSGARGEPHLELSSADVPLNPAGPMDAREQLTHVCQSLTQSLVHPGGGTIDRSRERQIVRARRTQCNRQCVCAPGRRGPLASPRAAGTVSLAQPRDARGSRTVQACQGLLNRAVW